MAASLNTIAAQKLARHIGHTPMLAIRYRADGREGEVLVKCEQYNLSGSVKDRLVLAALKAAIADGSVTQNSTLLHIGAGNMALSVAQIAKSLGLASILLTTGWQTQALRQLLKDSFRKIELFDNQLQLQQRALELEAYGYVSLMANQSPDIAAEILAQTLGREIAYALLLEHLHPTALVAGTDSGATLNGIASFLEKFFPGLIVVPVAIRTMINETHLVQGLKQAEKDPKAFYVSQADSISMAGKLSRELGLLVGYSAGANLLAAIELQQQFGGKPVVTVFPDDNKRYDTDRVLPGTESERCSDIALISRRELKKVDF